jgi:hypothetical protein
MFVDNWYASGCVSSSSTATPSVFFACLRGSLRLFDPYSMTVQGPARSGFITGDCLTTLFSSEVLNAFVR